MTNESLKSDWRVKSFQEYMSQLVNATATLMTRSPKEQKEITDEFNNEFELFVEAIHEWGKQ